MKGKKILGMILLIIPLCFCVTACDPPQFYRGYEKLNETVVGIELINYSNLEQKTINTTLDKNPEKKILPFEFDQMEIVETLPAEKIADFLQDYSEMFVMASYNHPNSSNGQSIRLIYNDTTFEVISCSAKGCFIAIYAENGKAIRYVGMTGNNDFRTIVNTYFDTKVN